MSIQKLFHELENNVFRATVDIVNDSATVTIGIQREEIKGLKNVKNIEDVVSNLTRGYEEEQWADIPLETREAVRTLIGLLHKEFENPKHKVTSYEINYKHDETEVTVYSKEEDITVELLFATNYTDATQEEVDFLSYYIYIGIFYAYDVQDFKNFDMYLKTLRGNGITV